MDGNGVVRVGVLPGHPLAVDISAALENFGYNWTKSGGFRMLTENTLAPDFSLPDETGTLHQLSQYRGKYVVLYFYPKDDTPGCTTQACRFKDDYSAYEKAEVVILGVSPDSPQSHMKFKKKFMLPFTLLADQEKQVCELYGVWGKKKMFGKDYFGVKRTTFLISPDGIIVKVFKNVKPSENSTEILAALS